MQQQIVEIDGVGPQQPLGIERIDPLDDVPSGCPLRGVYSAGEIRLFLAQLMAWAMRSGV